MAVFSAILGFSGDAGATASLNTVTSTAEIVLGPNAIFAIRATSATAGSGDFNLKFGNSGMAAASATDFQFPSNQVFTLQTGDHTDRIRIFNPGAAAITYWVQRLDRY